jgi:4-amino-4-deoxy-L-arabinose transferase-like glycosyltransferase
MERMKTSDFNSLAVSPAGFAFRGRWTETQFLFALVGALISLRFILATCLPLSFDEAYFWLWSKHLAISYYDHPPLIALSIRAGTLAFGDTELGVRFVSLLLSVVTSIAVWRSGEILAGNDIVGARACAFLNATLMMTTESLGATPDALVLCAAAVLIWSMAQLESTKDGRWWLAAGLTVGLALFSKYTAFFLCASIAAWLVITPQGRKWLRTPWPYIGASVATSFLISTVIWNASHDWISFKFQFGRVAGGHLTLRYLAELIGGQIALASPFILVLGIFGLQRETFSSKLRGPLAFGALIVWPPLMYFLFHSLHERVQGNWPSFIYPALVLMAAAATPTIPGESQSPIARFSARFALPAATLILFAVYTQAAFSILPIGYSDPIARMTAVGAAPVMQEISDLVQDNHARAIVTTKYVTTGWLLFYLRPHVPVIQVNEEYRWLSSPQATTEVLNEPLLYVTQNPSQELASVAQHFSHIAFIATLNRMRNGVTIDHFNVYRLSGFHGAPTGRMP